MRAQDWVWFGLCCLGGTVGLTCLFAVGFEAGKRRMVKTARLIAAELAKEKCAFVDAGDVNGRKQEVFTEVVEHYHLGD